MANKITKFLTRALRGIVDISLFGMLLVGCQMQVSSDITHRLKTEDAWLTPPTQVSANVHAVILPHHLLVESFMEKFYSQLAGSNSYDRIVILSPNHFGIGHSFIQTASEIDTSSVALDMEWINSLVESNILDVDNRNFGMEHGVFVHYPFIARHFPDAKIVPIIMKTDTPCGPLKMLSEKLKELSAQGRSTLYLASLDFTHYTQESVAVLNDRRTIQWLEQSTNTDYDLCSSARTIAIGSNLIDKEAVAVDSPATLYVMADLMNSLHVNNFTFWARTSSAALIPDLIPKDNTSHIFGYYSGS